MRVSNSCISYNYRSSFLLDFFSTVSDSLGYKATDFKLYFSSAFAIHFARLIVVFH